MLESAVMPKIQTPASTPSLPKGSPLVIRIRTSTLAAAVPSTPAPVPPTPEQTPEQRTPTQQAKKPRKPRLPDWGKDGLGDGPSSLDLLLQWLELPNNINRWRNGYDGKTQKNASAECAAWLAAHDAPMTRDAESCNFKIHALFKEWKEANQYKNGTGNGQGGWLVSRAEEKGVQADIDFEIARVERNVRQLCPLWDLLDPIFQEQDGGDVSLRSDTLQDYNPTVATLESALFGPAHSPGARGTPDDRNDATDVEESAQDAAETRSRSSRQLTAHRSFGSALDVNRKTDIASDDQTISERNKKKKKLHSRHASADLADEILRRDEEYRVKKLARLDEMLVIKQQRARTEQAQAVIALARDIKAAAPETAWEDCKAEARIELGIDS